MDYSSFCGVKCETCKLYIASTENDDEAKLAVVKDWGLYKEGMTAKEVSCGGCKSGNVFGACGECDIRRCNETRHIACCGECDIYPCGRIEKFYIYQITKETGVDFEDYVIK